MTQDSRRVLVVEDDRGTRDLVVFILRDAGYQVATACDGWEGLAQAERSSPDVVVLDLGLPGLNGFEVTRRLRQRAGVGVIVMTGSDELADEERALDTGADDFVTKPVDGAVLLARLRALQRRLRPEAEEVRRIGDLVIDDGHHVITSNGQPVDATLTEYGILSVLARQHGRPISKERLLKEVWGPDYVGDRHQGRMVEVHISRLRQKLDQASGRRSIDTIRGVGYVLRSLTSESGREVDR